MIVLIKSLPLRIKHGIALLEQSMTGYKQSPFTINKFVKGFISQEKKNSNKMQTLSAGTVDPVSGKSSIKICNNLREER